MRRQSGYSLMEIMTAIGILAISAAIAFPSLIGWRNKAQLGRAARDVYSNFQKAKIEAARRNTACTITFTANGYTVYIDANDSWGPDSPPDTIINSTNWTQYPGVSLAAIPFAAPAGSIVFAPNGFPNDNTGALAGGTVLLNDQGGNTSSITLSPAGNVRIN